MIEYYCQANENPVKMYDTDKLLDDCLKLIQEAREKLCDRDYPVQIVLPIDYFSALRDALAKDVPKQLSVVGSLNPYVNKLFGATLHLSRLVDKVIVY